MLAVGVVAALAFLAAGAIALDTFVRASVTRNVAEMPPVRPAPVTVNEYDDAARAALEPFFAWVGTLVDSSVQPTSAVVDQAQADLLAARVPSERKDFHLAAVLLLDAWRSALQTGGSLDAALAGTTSLIDDNPWLVQ